MKNGFTLAEVLITLAIIGVIGALTVPALIQNTQKQEYVSALKKAYSTLSQVTQQIITDEGSAAEWESTDNIYTKYKEKLNTIKECGTGAGCWPQSSDYKYLNGSAAGGWDIENSQRCGKIILADGASIAFAYNTAECNSNWDNGGLQNFCGRIYIDVNGAKKPNQIGRDVFFFGIKKTGIYPAGVDGAADRTCSTSNAAGGKFGEGCAARVLSEGAMNY